MGRWFSILLLLAAAAFAANFRLYLKDGSYQLVREYKIEGDRVRFYTVERSEWEEMPLALLDLKRTESERQARQQELAKEAAEMSAEEHYERQQREEREQVPVEPGVYLVENGKLRTLKQAESKIVTKKSRSVLKVVVPVPVVSGKATVELDGGRSPNVVAENRPEFYFRLAHDERFLLVKLEVKKGARVVQHWDIVPVTNEVIEKEDEVPIFRKQVDDGLYKIWPEQPLAPGEYAVIEYTQGQRNIQTWDFSRKD